MTFKDIISLWPSRPVLAKKLGLPKVNVDMWFHRDSIPPAHWHALSSLARRERKSGVTIEQLATLHAERFNS